MTEYLDTWRIRTSWKELLISNRPTSQDNNRRGRLYGNGDSKAGGSRLDELEEMPCATEGCQ